jgi:hypothetical protein
VISAPATAALAGTTSRFPVEAPAAGTTIAAAAPVVILPVTITVAAVASGAVPVAGAPQAVAVRRVRGHRRPAQPSP